jgi:hypothetical protein
VLVDSRPSKYAAIEVEGAIPDAMAMGGLP